MSDIFATTDGLILNIYYLHFLSSSIAEPIMKQKKRSLFFDEQYNLRISTSSLKKGEKNSLQKKRQVQLFMYVCMERSSTCHTMLSKRENFSHFLKYFFLVNFRTSHL